MELIANIFIIVGFLAIYVTPIYIAYRRKHKMSRAIMLLTLLAGWTLAGWAIAFFWARSKNVRDQEEISKSNVSTEEKRAFLPEGFKLEGANKVIVVSALTLISLMLLSFVFIGAPKENPCNETLAYSMFKIYGKDYFKSPSTVKFAPHGSARVSTADCYAYSIYTYADAQNSYGATIRSDVKGEIKKEGKGWKIINVNISR